jgi:hypothetical protein
MIGNQYEKIGNIVKIIREYSAWKKLKFYSLIFSEFLSFSENIMVKNCQSHTKIVRIVKIGNLNWSFFSLIGISFNQINQGENKFSEIDLSKNLIFTLTSINNSQIR